MKDRLTREESHELIMLGVSPERASMVQLEDPATRCGFRTIEKKNISERLGKVSPPIFSLADILELLPRSIKCTPAQWDLNICPIHRGWRARYATYVSSEEIKEEYAYELIDALFALLKWTLINNHA